MHTDFVIVIMDNYKYYINESWDATFTLITTKGFLRNLPLYGRIKYNTSNYVIWKRTMLKYHGNKCSNTSQYCYGKLHLHHITFVSEDGTNLPDNIEILCELHHALEHPDVCIGNFEFNDEITELVLYNSVNKYMYNTYAYQ